MAPKAAEKKNQNKKTQNTNKDKKQVQEKVSSKKNKSAKAAKNRSSGPVAVCCTFLLGTFLVFGLTGALIGYDTYRAGGKFENSHTGQLVKQAGLLPAVEDAWASTLKYSARGYQWTEIQVPLYYKKISKSLGPYVEFSVEFSRILFRNLKKFSCNMKALSAEKLPSFTKTCEQVAVTIRSTYATTSEQISTFFKTKVFVGQLSPENLGKAFNSTQQAAAQYYSWFREQVDFYADE